MKKSVVVWLSFFLLLFVGEVLAQAKSDSVRVLFIGNSYTFVNDLPETVRQIALSQGVRLAYTQFTPGGSYLKQHAKNQELLTAIKKGGWDYVVMQEQSAAPAMPTEVVSANTYPAARELNRWIRQHNPQAQVIFYMTWGHKDGCQEPQENYPLIDCYQGMQERLKNSYLEMAYQNNAWCAPVGMAWQRVRSERPDYLLYMPDRSHPSVLGSYLAANVIFATMFQRPYQTGVMLDLVPEQCEYIQQVAQQTVFGHKRLLNIQK